MCKRGGKPGDSFLPGIKSDEGESRMATMKLAPNERVPPSDLTSRLAQLPKPHLHYLLDPQPS